MSTEKPILPDNYVVDLLNADNLRNEFFCEFKPNPLPIYIWAGNNFQATDLAKCLGLQKSEFRVLHGLNQLYGIRGVNILTYGYFFKNREFTQMWSVGVANRCNFVNVRAIDANTVNYVKSKLGELK